MRLAILNGLLASSSTTTVSVDQRAPLETAPIRRVWPRVVAALAFFAIFEGILFHTRLYSRFIEPDSTTGALETQLRNEIRRTKRDRNQVLAVGHSRMSLLPRVVNQDKPGTGYTFASIGLGGTTPRIWYYALRAVDPGARKYAAIVIPTDDYNEPDAFDYQSERESDLHYLIARLQLQDVLEFPWTYQSKTLQWTIARGTILKGTIYKRDFAEFLAHPIQRIKKARYVESDSAAWFYGYGGTEQNLGGLQIDWQHKTIQFPSRIPEEKREQIQNMLFPDRPPDQGRETAYLRYWYGKIIDYYRGSGTKLIFMRVPRAPTSPPDTAAKPYSAIRQIASLPNVIVLDEHLFDELERPDFFWDAWHLNRQGMEAFSRLLATNVRRVLGPPAS
jgi:hypothetical protein